MASHPKSPLARWRRVQLAKHLIETGGYGLGQFDYDADGGLAHLRADRSAVEAVVDQGVAFMTNGCPGEKGEPGCTRPYGSYRPAEPFRDYPFVPAAGDLRDIRAQLALDGFVS
jgi:biotin synthase